MARPSFIPADLDPASPEQLEALYRALVDRPVTSAADLERWLLDASTLDEIIDELGSRRYIDNTCHTDDPEIEAAYLSFVEEIEPLVKRWTFALQQKLVASPYRDELPTERYEGLQRSWTNAVELFREENIALETEQSKLFTEYGKITGAMLVELHDQKLTIQQVAKLLEEPERERRRTAWVAITERRERERERLDGLFSQLLSLREQTASNAGFDDYRAFAFRQRERFDYTPEDCLHFGDAIAELCVPVVEALDRERRQRMGLERLRPWDLAVDPEGRAPLRPFNEDEIPRFIEKTGQIFNRISPALGQQFSQLRPGRNLDLDSREGKRPGGYQASLERSRQPFIFMNAVGTQRDVETLLHEGGHAFHYLDAADEPLVFLRHAPLEFCEVASMSMELLGGRELEVFYDTEDAARARRKHLEGIVRFLPWMATIDGFQHWIYTHPGHSSEERREAWLEILGRFSSREVDWSGHERARDWRWQAQIHLYGMPFYYIEYGIAQLGALQMWLNYRRDAAEALAQLRRAFTLGGTRPLPALFEAAGLRFDLSTATLAPLLEAIHQELARLEAEK